MASSILTWRRTSASKTGTALANLISDTVSAVNAVSGDSDYAWQVASSDTSGNPNYVVLKRKDASAGRILILGYGSSPSGWPGAIFDVSGNTSSNPYVAYFPAGNVDTPSNLASASGTIMGDDTAAVKACYIGTLSNVYPASTFPSIFMSEEAVWFTFQTETSAANIAWCGAGLIYVDTDDESVAGCFSTASAAGNYMNNFYSSSNPSWSATVPSAGSISAGHQVARVNKNGVSTAYYRAFSLLSDWSQATATTNVLVDTGIARAWFLPVALLCRTKGIGLDIKIRQLAAGPITSNAYEVYDTATLTPAAINMNGNSSGSVSSPWLTNFKV